MKENIKNIIKIVVFVLLFAGFYTCLTYSKRIKNVDQLNIAGLYGEKKDSLDMIYIGGSASFVYYQPLTAFENYGIASYDFGTNTIQPEFYKYMTKEALKVQSPKLLVVDARAFQYREKDLPPTEAAYRSALTAMPLDKEKIDFISNYVPKLNESENRDKKTYIFDLKKYHSNLNHEYEKSLEMMMGNYKNENKGFYFVNYAKKVMPEEKIYTEEETKVAKETDDILKEYLEYLKTLKGTKVLFIVSPYVEIEDEKKVFNYVGRTIKENGFDFIDANDYKDTMNLDYDKDFYNFAHMSLYGSDKFTEFLSNYMIENYNLPDRRKDKNYDFWKELLPAWNQGKLDCKNNIDTFVNGAEYAYEEPISR